MITFAALLLFPKNPAELSHWLVPQAEAAPIVLNSTTTVAAYVASYSQLDKFYETLECESRFDANAVGDRGRSFGVAQIFLPAHPDITKEQALDPKWAIDWAAHEWMLGHQRQWTCYGIVTKASQVNAGMGA